jgi:hypothetical protein
MKKENIINYLILIVGALLLLNSFRLLVLWMMGSDIFLKSDTPIILLIWGPVLGLTLFMSGSKGLKEQGYLSRFIKRRSGTLVFILAAVVLMVLFNLK